MAKPVIPQGFVLDESNNQTQNNGLPTGFVLDEQDISQNNEENKMPMGEAAFTIATNPFSFGDEIKAGIAAGVAKLFGGEATRNIDIGDLYREARTAERAKLEKARQDRPLTSFAGQVFSDVGIAGKALKATGLAGQGFGTAVKGGAVLGGASALGETEDLKDIPQTLEDTAQGAVAGGVVGGAVQKAIPALQNITPTVSNIAKKGLQKAVGITPKSRETLKAFEESGVSPTLADITEGNSTKTFQNFLGNFPGGRGEIEKAKQKQINDITKQIANITKGEGGTIQETGKVIQKGAKNLKGALENRISQNYDELDKFLPKEMIEPATKARQNLFEIARGNSGIQTEQELFDLAKQYQQALKEATNSKSLFQFIKEKGGIADYKGELKSLGITNKTLPGLLRKEDSKGVGIDDVGEKLMEAGYFSERPTINEVLDLIEREARGEKVILNQMDDAIQFINEVDSYGIDFKAIKQLQKTPKISGEIKQLQKIPTNNLRNITQDPQIQDVAAVGAGDTAKVLSRYSQIIDGDGNISYPRLKIFRSTIGAKLQSPTLSGDERASLKKIYGALSNDMKEAIVASSGEKGLQAFNKADKAFSRYQDILESRINPLIEAKTPEAVYSMAMSGTKQGGSNIRGIMKTLDSQQQEFVRGTVAKRMGLANAGEQDSVGEIFSPSKFLTEWSKLSPEAKNNIFTQSQNKAIENLNKSIFLIKETSKVRQTSNNLPYAAWAGLGTLTVANPAAGVSAIMGSKITANLMTNPKFINWLAAVSKSTPKELPTQLNRLSTITAANPEIREDVLEFIKSSENNDQQQNITK